MGGRGSSKEEVRVAVESMATAWGGTDTATRGTSSSVRGESQPWGPKGVCGRSEEMARDFTLHLFSPSRSSGRSRSRGID